MPLDQIEPTAGAAAVDAAIADAPTVGALALPARRDLMRQAGLGAALLGAAGAGLTSFASVPAQAATVTDGDVLNFALNLEYLEAEFYLRATTGKGLTAAEAGTGAGTVTGGSAVPFYSSNVHGIAADIAKDEHAHVLFLRSALGSGAVPRPTIDFTTAFTTLARAAGIVGPTGTFNPFSSDNNFLLGAYIFEDVGVTAYQGAAGLIANKAYLTAAAGILAVEAYHAGVIRLSILRANAQAIAIANKISALRAVLAGGPTDDFGPQLTPGTYNLASTDSNAITFPRTPTQVLNIVYGNTTTTPGLFYPQGLNGAVR